MEAKAQVASVATPPYAAAWQAWLSGEYARALEILDLAVPDGPREAAEIVLLRARTELRLGLAAEALATLDASLPDWDNETRAATAMLRGAVLARFEDFDAALLELERARFLSAGFDTPVRAEIAYYVSLVHWMRRDYQAAERALQDALREHRVEPVRVRALELKAWIAAGRECYSEASAALAAAVAAHERSREKDAASLVKIVHNLSIFARELYEPRRVALVRRSFHRLMVPRDLSRDTFKIRRNLAWCSALEGCETAALRAFSESARTAPSAPWRCIALLDRATLLLGIGERVGAMAELDEARELAASVDWENTRSDERVALLMLANLTASESVSAARSYLRRYAAIGKKMDPLLAFRNDRRLVALERFTRGVVEKAAGDEESASDELSRAMQVWREIGFHPRGALAALELYDVTRSASALDYAIEATESIPNSWIAKRVGPARLIRQDRLGKNLTPAQLEVLPGVLAGMKTKQIAAQLDRSPHTVRNHIVAVFRAFGVASRGELEAAVRKRGIA